jgi:starch phosphorylase
MEIALEKEIPTYSGGLGVLAGDTIRAAADLSVPMVAVTPLYRKGYFTQYFDEEGWQQEEAVEWTVEDHLEELPARVTVALEDRNVVVRGWQYDAVGHSGYTVPVIFLDTDLPQNSAYDRSLTDELYGGDSRYRLCQETILGIGGVRMLQALGYNGIERFHLNEGHASLLTVELLKQSVQRSPRTELSREDVDMVRDHCIFTTHTPVPAGHDKFSLELARSILDREIDLTKLQELFDWGDTLNMTHLALELSRYVNGVAKKHGEVSRMMFSGYPIDSITNGVHAGTWTSEPFKGLFDDYFPGWRRDKFTLRHAMSIPKSKIWDAHAEAKNNLLDYVEQETGRVLDPDVFTIGFARRAATYKRANLLFHDIDRLKRMAEAIGPMQIIYAGKAHPQDEGGKQLIQSIFKAEKELRQDIPVVYVPNYDVEAGKYITTGVDLWLNNPQPPKEASGTSGMKAALNGIPNLSVLDGWWIEGHIEGITGWSIGDLPEVYENNHDPGRDARFLYEQLEEEILPMFYNDREEFTAIMRQSIALNGSFFHTQRMMQEYVVKAYFLGHTGVQQDPDAVSAGESSIAS